MPKISSSQPSQPSQQAVSAAAAGDSSRRSTTADQDASRSATMAVSLPIVVAGSARISDVGMKNKVVWNELLAYIFYYRNKANGSAMTETVLRHFSAEDIANAKRLLVHEFHDAPAAGQFCTERRNSAVRSAHEAEVDDIVGLFQAADADTNQLLDGYLFVASEFSQLPKFGPEELNVAAVVDRQVRMDESIKLLSAAVEKM